MNGILSIKEGRRKFMEHQEDLRYADDFAEEKALDGLSRVRDMNSCNRSNC